ncbi:hypothetical protein MRX96_033681 [Rhipicephalus microplus]
MRLQLSTLLSVDLVLLYVTGGVPWRRSTFLLPAAARREPACGRFGAWQQLARCARGMSSPQRRPPDAAS